MIKVKIFEDKDNIKGFSVFGHANYGKYNEDIVCAGVSTLTINLINTFEEILDFDDFSYAVDNTNTGLIDFELIKNIDDPKGQLLLRSFELGIKSLEKEYNNYIDLSYGEV